MAAQNLATAAIIAAPALLTLRRTEPQALALLSERVIGSSGPS